MKKIESSEEIRNQVDMLIGKGYNRAELRRRLREIGKETGIDRLWYMWQLFIVRNILKEREHKGEV